MNAKKEDQTNMVSGERLRAFVERMERLNEETYALAADKAAVMAEAKATGYTPKYIRAILKLRKKTPSEQDEDTAMMDLYTSALGMARETPLFRHVEGMGTDVAAKESVIEALKLLAPQDGEITVKIGGGPRVRLWRDKDGVRVEEVKDIPTPTTPNTNSSASGLSRPGDNAPDCSEDEAFALGAAARHNDEPVIANPFAWDDARRRRWDEGWRDEDGGDGMGPA